MTPPAPLDRRVLDLRPPVELASPWATRPRRQPDGRYLEVETGLARSLPAWVDEFSRHRERDRPRWSRSAGGVLHVLDGDRVGVLWPGWSAGHVAVVGELDAVPLLEGGTFGQARRAVEEWALGRERARLAAVDVDARLAGQG